MKLTDMIKLVRWIAIDGPGKGKQTTWHVADTLSPMQATICNRPHPEVHESSSVTLGEFKDAALKDPTAYCRTCVAWT